MRKLRKWERYVLFRKTKDNPLEGEIPLNIAQKEVKARKAWQKPIVFIRSMFGKLTLLLRTKSVAASGKGNPFFGNPSTALRVGFDSLPKNSRSAVEQQSKTSRTTLEEESKRSRRTLEQHPKESRTSLEQQMKKWDKAEELISTPVNVDERRVIFSIDVFYRQHDMPGVRDVLSRKVVHSCPEQVLPIRQVCVKYTLSNDIVLKGYSTKVLISGVKWPHAMSILYKIADIFKSPVHKNGTSTIQNPYCANTEDRDNTLPSTYQVRPASDRHGFSTASRRLRAPMAIGARSDNDQSAKPEMQNKSGRKGEQREKLIRTTSEKNAITLQSLYQKATVSIRVTYQKYTLDLLKTYQRLTKKLPTAYHEVGDKLQVAYAKFKNNLHGFSKYCVALWCDNQLGPILITSRFSRSRALFCQPFAIWFISVFCSYVLFSEAQAQSVETRTVDGLNKIAERSKTVFPRIKYPISNDDFIPLKVGDTIPDLLWDLPIVIVTEQLNTYKTTLRESRDKKIIVLDFWARWCAPCVKSVDKWEFYQEIFPDFVQLFNVHLDYDDKAMPFAISRSWKSPVVIAKSAWQLNRFFFPTFTPSRVIWIVDGRLHAITGTSSEHAEDIVKIIKDGASDSLTSIFDGSYMYNLKNEAK